MERWRCIGRYVWDCTLEKHKIIRVVLLLSVFLSEPLSPEDSKHNRVGKRAGADLARTQKCT